MKAETEHMTAAEARQFDTFSIGNAALAESMLSCGCEAYRDIFTYKRWKAQGFQVQRGQKAIRLPLLKSVTREDKETGEVKTHRIMGRSAVFCRCQVRPIGGAS
jgi:hypothetical protein